MNRTPGCTAPLRARKALAAMPLCTMALMAASSVGCVAQTGDAPTSGEDGYVDMLPEQLIYNGLTANANSSCMAHNARIASKDINSIYDAWGNYHGWAEWRQGTQGECNGWQWVRVHITSDIGDTRIQYVYQGQSLESIINGPYLAEFYWSSGLWPAQHEGPLLYAPDNIICARLDTSSDDKSHIYFFGHGGVLSPTYGM